MKEEEVAMVMDLHMTKIKRNLNIKTLLTSLEEVEVEEEVEAFLYPIQCHYCKKYGHTQPYSRIKMADEGNSDARYMHENVQAKEGDESVLLACHASEEVVLKFGILIVILAIT